MTGLIGLGLVVLFLVLIGGFAVLAQRRGAALLREIPAFQRLTGAIGLAVEDGSRVHISIGKGGLTGPEAAAAFVALAMVRRIARIASSSDSPPVVTSGEGTLAILSQDTLQSAYEAMGTREQYRPNLARLTGLTPFSFAAGVMPVVADEHASSNMLVGNFGSEVALMAAASERQGIFSLGGSDNLSAQAVLYASASEPLIGEELYAGGAYLDAGPTHTASLQAQDLVRLGVVLVILAGAVLRFFGFLS